MRVPVGRSDDVLERGRLVVALDEATVGVFRIDGSLVAYENSCAHQGGPVCQGRLMPGVTEKLDSDADDTAQFFDEQDPHIVCPWHGYEYHLRTGVHAGASHIALRRFEVEEEDGTIYVTL
jgi:nitrite reductase/ring-hydroxylating ferredoxin subunit